MIVYVDCLCVFTIRQAHIRINSYNNCLATKPPTVGQQWQQQPTTAVIYLPTYCSNTTSTWNTHTHTQPWASASVEVVQRKKKVSPHVTTSTIVCPPNLSFQSASASLSLLLSSFGVEWERNMILYWLHSDCYLWSQVSDSNSIQSGKLMFPFS